jgi:hypothetical protein
VEVLNTVEEITPHLKNHGGGPKTEAGKQRSSQNARKHLAFAKLELLAQEHQDHFDGIWEAFQEELKPRTAVEECLVRNLAELQWRMGRVVNGETKAIHLAGEEGESSDKATEKFGRYSGQLGRQFQATLKMLKDHQAPRLEHMSQEWRQAVLIRDHYQRQSIDWDPAVDEFVFSKEQLDQQIRFNKQWARFVKNVIIYPTTKYQDERFLKKAL